MPKNHATLADIAREVGVSISAVSKALSNGGGETTKISAATKARIEKAAREMRYTPSDVARMMHGGQSKMVGILFPNIAEAFYTGVVRHLVDMIGEHGFLSISASWHDNSGFAKAYEAIMRYRPAGIISCHADCEYQPCTPTILYGNVRKEYDYVEYSQGGHRAEAVKYLESLGHRRIGFLSSFSQKGNIAEQLNVHLGDERWNIKCDNSFDAGADAAKNLLALPQSERPTAIVCFNDTAAIGLISGLTSGGLSVPRDISVTGSDNLPIACHYNPPLTTFDMRAREVASNLVELLFRRMDNPEAPLEKRTIVPSFIIRQSCSSPLQEHKRSLRNDETK